MKDPTTIVLLVISSLISICGGVYLYFSPNHLWETITGVATVWLVFIAYWQLAIGNRTSTANFICKFTDSFFVKNTRDLIMLLDNEALKYQDSGSDFPPCFIIDEAKVKKLCLDKKKEDDLIARKRYSAYEIDDWLLGPLEDVGYFEKNGLVNIDQAYHDFGWYVDLAIDEDGPIMKYVTYSQKGDSDVYENFLYLAKKLDSYRRERKPIKQP
jgi:hypothetical protein